MSVGAPAGRPGRPGTRACSASRARRTRAPRPASGARSRSRVDGVHRDPVPGRRQRGQHRRAAEPVPALPGGLASRLRVGQPQVAAGRGRAVPGGEERAAGGLEQYPADRVVPGPVGVRRRAGPVQVRADGERGERGVPGEPPLPAGGLPQRAAEPAELRRQRDLEVAHVVELGDVPPHDRGDVRPGARCPGYRRRRRSGPGQRGGAAREDLPRERARVRRRATEPRQQAVGKQVTGPDLCHGPVSLPTGSR